MIPQGPAEVQPLEVDDFSGGITDYYIAGPSNRCQKCDNLRVFLYGEKGKLLSRPGSTIYNSTFPRVPTGSVRFGRTIYFQSNVLPYSANILYSLSGAGWTALTGPTTNQCFPSATTTQTNVVVTAEDANHLLLAVDSYAAISKLYVDTGVLKLRTAGLPRLASSPIITPGANTGKTYLYRFIMTYTYTANGVSFKTEGGFTQVTCSNADAPNTNPNAITAIPVLANGTTTNYDTATIKVEIYRTINNGSSVYYLAGSVTNGTTTFNDNMSDTTLQLQQQLYTNGGVVENTPLPAARTVHIVPNGIAYYGSVLTGGETITNRVIQSVPGAIDSVNSNFFVDLPDDVIGLSSARGLPVALCSKGVYRLDGQFDELGRGGIVADRIDDTAGCISSQSVVQTTEGVFWAGETGFYFTDGYQVLKINQQWPTTYQTFCQTAQQKSRIQGAYDRFYRRVSWTVQTSEAAASDCDKIYTLHLDFGIKKESTFTSDSGGTQFAPSSIVFIDNSMLRGHALGYLLLHEDGVYTDPKVDGALATTAWDTLPITYDYKSVAHNFGTNIIRKFTPRINLSATNVTNASIQINSITDDGRIIQSLKPIRYRGNSVWGDPSPVWGTPTDLWNVDGLINASRRFPRNSLRCSYKQIQITNDTRSVITSSDSLNTVIVDSTAKTATLTLVGGVWPTDILNYYISFSSDSYVNEFLVTAISTNVITFQDSLSLSPTGTLSWVIRGTPKGEALGLLSYTIHYVLMGKTERPYTYAEGGEVGSATR